MVRKGSRVGGKTESNKVRRKKSLTEKKKMHAFGWREGV